MTWEKKEYLWASNYLRNRYYFFEAKKGAITYFIRKPRMWWKPFHYLGSRLSKFNNSFIKKIHFGLSVKIDNFTRRYLECSLPIKNKNV